MRFAPESDDPDNAGLSIIRDLYVLNLHWAHWLTKLRLLPVKKAHPDISFADLYTAAACYGIEFLGGPKVPFNLGRSGMLKRREVVLIGLQMIKMVHVAQHMVVSQMLLRMLPT